MKGGRLSRRGTLREIFSVRERFCRSVNIGLDWQSSSQLDGYILTETARSLARDIALSGVAKTRSRAWTITGPYGSGKSAFALFLTDLLAKSLPVHGEARKLRSEIGLGRSRLFPLLVVGKRAPLGRTLLESIAHSIAPLSRSLARKAEHASRASHSESLLGPLLSEASTVAVRRGHGGVLLVIDELGKFLEYSAAREDESDVFALQEVAELAARSGDHPFVCVTVLHTAFAEYVSHLDTARRSEWQKIQGRFTDVAFHQPAEQFMNLIAAAIQCKESSRVAAVGRSGVLRSLRVGCLREARTRMRLADTLPKCLPLHPLTALMLWPIFRSKLAQNERSLFAFLGSHEPLGFQDFLSEPLGMLLPTYNLDRLYDYIVYALGDATYRGERSRRWAEVGNALSRIGSDAPELSDRVVKAMGLLNLYGQSVGVRASSEALAMALGDKVKVSGALKYLENKSIAVYRKYDLSYALWEGSDIDLDSLYEQARAHRQAGALSSRVSKVVRIGPIVARRHYIKSGTLRYFDIEVVDGSEEEIGKALSALSRADGRITFVLTTDARKRDQLIRFAKGKTADGKTPLSILAFPRPMSGLDDAVADAEAWAWIAANEPRLRGDAVARQEVRSRSLLALEHVQAILGRTLGLRGSAFDPNASDWVAAGCIQRDRTARAFHRWLSELCDQVFNEAPTLKNELLNRNELSTAAARARRNLLELMISAMGKERLGMAGCPPELSMYRSMIEAGGFHARRKGNWAFARPSGDWLRAWTAMEEFAKQAGPERRSVAELFAILKRPPFGLREGPLPVLLCCLLLEKRDKIALYEEGVFIADLRIEGLERLLRAPDRFEIQEHAIGNADRSVLAALHQLVEAMELSQGALPDSAILQIVKPLVLFAARLPAYVRQTKRVPDFAAVRVRDVLLGAKDPYELVFSDLPVALDVQLDRSPQAIAEFTARLSDALRIIKRAYPQFLDEIEGQLRSAFVLSGTAEAVRKQLQARAIPLAGRTVDPNLNTVIHSLTNIGERDWRELLGAAIMRGVPPSQWSDSDAVSFHVKLAQLARDFIRLEELVSEQMRTGASSILRIGILNGQAKEARAIISVEKNEAGEVVDLSNAFGSVVTSSRANRVSERLILAALANVVMGILGEEEIAAPVDSDRPQ